MQTPRRREIVVVDYEPGWPAMFEEERRRILSSVPWIQAIEHVGSTSVPGLAAKPTIDMLAAVEDLSDAEVGREQLEALGYQFLPDPTLPERRYFRRLSGLEHTHHLHVYACAGFLDRRELIFRDHLRRHPEPAQEYGALKRDLATRFSGVPEYTDAKTEFIWEVVGRALRERGVDRVARGDIPGGMIERALPADLTEVEALLGGDGLVLDGVHEAFGFLVARGAGAVVGSIGLEVYGRGGLVRSVVVKPERRGSGIGTQLVVAALAWARELGVGELYLLTATADRFFARFGFEPVERGVVPSSVLGSREFSASCCETATIMGRPAPAS